MWDRILAADKSSSSIDAHDQVEPFDFHLFDAGHLDSTGIINQNVEPTKSFDGQLDGFLH